LHGEHRHGHDGERGDRHEQARPAALGDQVGPAAIEAAAVVRLGVPGGLPGEPAPDPPGQRAQADDAEHGRDEGDRDEHGDDDRAGRREAHLGQERDAGHGQPGQRDDHGDAGRDDRRPGRADGSADRLGHRPAGAELLPVAGEDEQRVVDAHGQAEHDGQDGGGGLQVDEARQRGDAERADRDPDDRGQQVHPGGHERAVGDRQHDERGDHADCLGRPADVGPGLQGGAADLGGQPGRARVGHGSQQCAPLGVGDVGLPDGVGDGAVRGPLVARDGRGIGVQRVARVGHPGQLLQSGDHLRDLAGVAGVGDRPVGRRLEHDLGGRPVGRLAEPLADHVQRGRGLLARDAERVDRLAGQQHGAGAGGEQHDDPDERDGEPVAGRAEPQPVQEGGHARTSFQCPSASVLSATRCPRTSSDV
jgi:hypothetical protein